MKSNQRKTNQPKTHQNPRWQKTITTGLTVISGFTSHAAMAALPTVTPPTSGGGGGGFMGQIQGYAADFVILAGLLIAAVTFVIVAKNTISKYGDVANRQATMGEVAMHAAVGVLVLIVVVWLMTEAATVLV